MGGHEFDLTMIFSFLFFSFLFLFFVVALLPFELAHILGPGSSTVHLLIRDLLSREEIVVDSPVIFQWWVPLKIKFYIFHLCLSHTLKTYSKQ